MSATTEQLHDETLRKIGRNVVNFQRLEAALKALVLSSRAAGTIDDLQTHHAARAKSLKKRPLGDIAETFHNSIYKDGDPPAPPESAVSPWLSTSLKLEIDSVEVKERKRRLLALIAERNRLIHSDLVNFDPSSAESCARLTALLDDQNPRILEQLSALKELRDGYRAILQELLEYFDSDEFLASLKREMRGA